jgi:hypothetical protein
MNNYYVYQYLREDGSPYYIGKGKGNRAYLNNRVTPKPTDLNRIIIVKDELTEDEAFKLESKLIVKYGRKDTGTGILRNLTNGGEGVSGRIDTVETISKRVSKNTGKKRTLEQKERMRQAQLNRKHKTKEEKLKISAKISQSLKGKNLDPKSETHKKNLSKSLLGKYKGVPKSEETKQKMRKPKSEKHRKAIAEGRRAKYAALRAREC